MKKILTIQEAVEILKKGGVVIFPTDTAYGIGCEMDNPVAVEKLFRIRHRPTTQATPVLVDSIEMARGYLKEIPEDVEQDLMKRYWPGALTIILPVITERVPSLVRGRTETLGVRMPNNEIALELIRGLGKPMLGPSANFHGQPTPYTFESVDEDLISLSDGIIEGTCSVKRESTVINCSVRPWKIVRQGAIKLDKIMIKAY